MRGRTACSRLLQRWILAVLLMLGAATGAGAQPVAAPGKALPAVTDIRVSTTPNRARLIVDLAGKTDFAISALDAPDRIVVDMAAERITDNRPSSVAGTGIVSSYSLAMHAPGNARATLVLAQPAQVQQSYILDSFGDQPARLVIDLIPDEPEAFAIRVAQDAAALTTAAITPAKAVAAVPAGPNADEAATNGAPLVQTDRPLVVIDPGHGGLDNGASAPGGIHEKDIVLAFALKLQEVLIQSGRFDVALTREEDTFLRLEDRVALARENHADLFISIHADSFQQRDISGASVYTRDEKATDFLDKVLAEKENKSDVIAGFAVPQVTPEVVDILFDLMKREMRRQSFLAAQAIVHQLEPSVALRRFPVRQADFFVLQAPDIPSVLLELGFLSNPGDITNLQQDGWRDQVAEALAKGITAYFETDVNVAEPAQ